MFINKNCIVTMLLHQCDSVRATNAESVDFNNSGASYGILNVHRNYSLAEIEVEEAQAIANIRGIAAGTLTQFVKVTKESKYCESLLFAPCKLGQLYWFCEMLQLMREDGQDLPIVLCAGRSPEMITTCAQLMGSFLILFENFTADAVCDVFRPLSATFLDYGGSPRHRFTVFDCWHAVFRAKCLGWLDFENKAVDLDRCIDMHEYLHYDSHLNGCLHIIVPSKLLVFKCPSDFPLRRSASSEGTSSKQPGGRLWRDFKGERYFSAKYYAEVLSDFDVQAVVRSSAAAYNVRGFYRRVSLLLLFFAILARFFSSGSTQPPQGDTSSCL
jgi:hypothetical protein